MFRIFKNILVLLLLIAVSHSVLAQSTRDGFFLASQLSAATPSGLMSTPLIFGANNQVSAANTQYIIPQSYGGTTAWSLTETEKRLVMPISGTLKNLYIRLNSTNTTGNYTFTVFKNGSATGITCAVGTTLATCNDTVHTVAIAAGDTISLESDPNSPDLLTTYFQNSLLFTGSSAGESLILGATSSTLTATTPFYFPVQAVSIGSNSAANTQAAMPTSGVIDHLYIDADNSAGSGTVTVTLLKNGSSTALTATLTDPNTTATDLANSVSFSAGDLVGIEVTQTGTVDPINLRWGVRFLPTTNGESVQLFGSTALGTSSSTQYQGVAGGVTGTINATETNREQLMQASTVRSMYLDIVSALGGGVSVAFTVRKNTADTAITATISGAAQTTANDTVNSVAYSAGDRIAMKLVKSAGIIAGNGVHTGVVTYIAPTP
jgi:hypothetical protein